MSATPVRVRFTPRDGGLNVFYGSKLLGWVVPNDLERCWRAFDPDMTPVTKPDGSKINSRKFAAKLLFDAYQAAKVTKGQ